MNNEKRAQIFKRLHDANPHPKPELNYKTHFELLIATLLSAQATDVSVNKATKNLFKVANTPETMKALGLKKLKSYIKNIGLYNTKAANVLKTCDILIKEHQSTVPNDRKALEALPGVGRKTANIVLNVAFGEHTIAVDTHIFRIGNRTGIAKGKTPLAVEQALLKTTPALYKKEAHHWLILHGRYVCLARKPKCGACIIQELCEFKDKTDVV